MDAGLVNAAAANLAGAATAGDSAAFVMRHTEIIAPPLTPEIRLRLLCADSPLWQAFLAPGDMARAYWAFAWSGGQALARYLLDHCDLVAGRRVLDFAAGCGTAAIAAAQVGAAEVTAAEIDPIAVAAIGLNAQLNGVAVAARCEDLIYTPNQGWDVVLAGDIWYDTRLARHGQRWLRSLTDQGVLVLSADPGRHYTPSQGIQALARYRARSVPDLEHPNLQEVNVYRVLPIAEVGVNAEKRQSLEVAANIRSR